MNVQEVDVRIEPGLSIMVTLREDFHRDMSERYPGADYGPRTLPAGLHPPSGAFLVLFDGEQPVGCVGLRQLPADFAPDEPGRCAEGKSLFVKPAYRSGVAAVLLMQALIGKARELGYDWLYGNTGPEQPESLRLLRDGPWPTEEIDLYDPGNPLAAYAFRGRL